MESHWKAWTEARTADKARKVAGWALEAFARGGGRAALVGTERDDETDGHVLGFVVHVEAPTWSENVVSLLALAQGLGAGWNLSGSIRDELRIDTTRVSVPGVQLLLCVATRGADARADAVDA